MNKSIYFEASRLHIQSMLMRECSNKPDFRDLLPFKIYLTFISRLLQLQLISLNIVLSKSGDLKQARFIKSYVLQINVTDVSNKCCNCSSLETNEKHG